jgi:hypothetical protein
VMYKPVTQQQQQQGAEEAHIAVEVAAVISHPEQRDTTHTNTFRWVTNGSSCTHAGAGGECSR